MPNVTETNGCTTLSSSLPLFFIPLLSSFMFLSYFTPFPNPRLIPASPLRSPCTPSPCLFSVFPPPPPLSQSAICWRKPITAAFSNHRRGDIGGASFGIPTMSVQGRRGLVITGTRLYLKGQGVRCLRQPVCVCFN